MQNIPIPYRIKISYQNQLEIKLMVHQSFSFSKYLRHTLIILNCNIQESKKILRKYYPFISAGDYLQIFTETKFIRWVEKCGKKQENSYLDLENLLEFQQKNSQRNLKQILKKVLINSKKYQYQEMEILTIFIGPEYTSFQNIQINQNLLQLKQNFIVVNLFIYNYQDSNSQKIYLDRIKCYDMKSLSIELKKMFYQIQQIGLKKSKLQLHCLNGNLTLKDQQEKQRQYWLLKNGVLTNEQWFLQKNKTYIHSLEMRNLGYLQAYQFEINFQCIDSLNHKYCSKKLFTIKPSRQCFSNRPSKLFTNYYNGNRNISLCFENIQQQGVLESLQIYQTVSYIQIKNHSQSSSNDGTQI